MTETQLDERNLLEEQVRDLINNKHYSVKQVCEILGYSERHIRRIIKGMYIPSSRRKTCVWCGQTFVARSPNATYCKLCKAGRDNYGNYPLERKKRSNECLTAVLRDLTDYNVKNGTHLTYGQYVRMKEEGERNKVR